MFILKVNIALFRKKINHGDSMNTVLIDGVYRLLYVEYDFANGNHYFLRARISGDIIHFWDQKKTMKFVFISHQALFTKSTDQKGQVRIDGIMSAF